MGKMVYVTGPVRSGKSRWAVERAKAWGEGVVFVATYRPSDDADMAARIQRHRDERPGWRTLEAPRDIAAALDALNSLPSGVLLDCQTLWLSDRLDLDDETLLAAWDTQLAAFKSAPWPMMIVGNEVGWSPVPGSALTRRFRDLAGWLGQRSAAAADEAWLLVAGCPVKLK
jgi:adenosylcobinamide kinase/adenosylcobinamide-phosphate guanylyltransferase